MSRRGFALPSVVFAVAIMSIIVVAALSASSDERRASRAVRESTLAGYAAEAGLRQTFGAWPSVPVKALNPGDSLNLGWQNLNNTSQYRAVIHRLDKGGLQEYNVVVQGRRTGLNGGIGTIVGVVGGVPLLTYGVFAQTQITTSGNAFFDGYDSEEAPYNAATPDSTATLWSNGAISLTNTTVLGTVTSAGAIAGGGNVVSGGSTALAPAVPPMDIKTCPGGGFTAAASVPNGAGIAYNAGTGVLTVAGGGTITLTGANYYFSRVVLSGNSTLIVNPPAGGHVDVVISDLLNISGGTVTNLASTPTALGFSSCGSPAVPSTWALSGGAASAFSVYAPNHPVTLSGGGEVYGAVVSSTFTISGGSKLHYDAALARQASKKLVVQRTTWAQLGGN
ncbi:MAG: pilus assembly PilX family protein [Gemmatimonadaceae bacterium]